MTETKQENYIVITKKEKCSDLIYLTQSKWNLNFKNIITSNNDIYYMRCMTIEKDKCIEINMEDINFEDE